MTYADNPEELTPQQRAALAIYWITLGRRYTTGDFARRLGLTERGALYLLAKLSGTVPIYVDGDRTWRLCMQAEDWPY